MRYHSVSPIGSGFLKSNPVFLKAQWLDASPEVVFIGSKALWRGRCVTVERELVTAVSHQTWDVETLES